MAVYLQGDNKPFKIEKDLVEKILTRTHDRMYKLELLNTNGFEIEDFEKIKAEGEKNLSRPSKSRYVTFI